MTIEKQLQSAEAKLSTSSSPRLDAEVLLAYVLNVERSYLLAHFEQKLTLPQLMRYLWVVYRRGLKIPVAYLTHHKDFYGRTFYVDKRVLVPRPETETLIQECIRLIRANREISKVTDVGTGSGCMAITLACELPHIKIIATDISKPALKVAQKNAQRHGVADRITFLHGNLLAPVQAQQSALANTLLVANLPYILPKEYTGDIAHEPRGALVGGNDGLRFYQELAEQVSRLSASGRPKTILLELHPPTVEGVTAIVHELLPNYGSSIQFDLSQKPRVLSLVRM